MNTFEIILAVEVGILALAALAGLLHR